MIRVLTCPCVSVGVGDPEHGLSHGVVYPAESHYHFHIFFFSNDYVYIFRPGLSMK